MIREIKIDKEPFVEKRKLADYSEDSVMNKQTRNTIRYLNETKLKKKENCINKLSQNLNDLKNIGIKIDNSNSNDDENNNTDNYLSPSNNSLR